MVNKKYLADAIQVFEGLEHVKKRPDMYIGDTEEKGLHHLIWEIVDNSIDEITNGYGNTIEVILHSDGSISVKDDGRGVPVDLHPEKKISAARLVYETIGAGGKFDNSNYKTTGGLHGVGASVVNALSVKMDVEIAKGGYLYSLKYRNATLKQDIKKGKKTKNTGTKVTFLPDYSIFNGISFNPELIKNRLKELAFLNKGIKLVFKDEINNTSDTFNYSGGLLSFIKYLGEEKTLIGKPMCFEKEVKDVKIEVAFQYTDDVNSNILSFANNIKTIEGGKHDEGFKQALTRAFNEIFKAQNAEKKRGKKEIQIQGSDATEGLIAVVSIKLKTPKFGGQTKTQLTNPEIKGLVMSFTYDELMNYARDNARAIKVVLDKVTNSYLYRENARENREIKKKVRNLATEGIFSSDKFTDCTTRNAKEKEILIVEGNSAGGSAKEGRNRRFQAILSLRGKPLNVEKKKLKDVLNSEELKSIIAEVGAGFGDNFDIKKVKSQKIIIMTDADIDGSHIRLILLTFFYRYMRELIEAGFLYIANPPLYKVYNSSKLEYAYNDKDLKKAIKKIGKNYKIQRYKGLGEMDASQLWETTMNPEKRTLFRVSLDNVEIIEENVVSFMGPAVEPRREYLLENM